MQYPECVKGCAQGGLMGECRKCLNYLAYIEYLKIEQGDEGGQ